MKTSPANKAYAENSGDTGHVAHALESKPPQRFQRRHLADFLLGHPLARR